MSQQGGFIQTLIQTKFNLNHSREQTKWLKYFYVILNLCSYQWCARFEKLNIRSLSTQARVLGTLVCISGALTASLYKGPSLWTPSSSIPLHLSSHHPAAGSVKRKNWVLGGVFLFTAGICVSFWNILQVKSIRTLKSLV